MNAPRPSAAASNVTAPRKRDRSATTLARLCAAATREALVQGASPRDAERVAVLVVTEMLLRAGRFETARALMGIV